MFWLTYSIRSGGFKYLFVIFHIYIYMGLPHDEKHKNSLYEVTDRLPTVKKYKPSYLGEMESNLTNVKILTPQKWLYFEDPKNIPAKNRFIFHPSIGGPFGDSWDSTFFSDGGLRSTN